ncbi:VRR-NUC domain-containing protein [Anaeroselena agilis]|uniref:VRR-NUC domain-containing protein n=1 Tax=Anaeroselena agilis TaxID=3063788 RepID=A0ABU3NTU6_9FIRM|nr:VRR-NUC domain-containing protein [Selenomonadales bacterium 4137-cl]
MREKQIEQKLIRTVKAVGGLALKFTSPGMDGMPDRLVILPSNRIAFVEVKAHGMKTRPLQIKRHELLRRLGCRVYILDDETQIQQLLSEIKGGDAT